MFRGSTRMNSAWKSPANWRRSFAEKRAVEAEVRIERGFRRLLPLSNSAVRGRR